jgi:hypothetical protein
MNSPNRRSYRRLAAAILPLLLFRALIPVGFMLVPGTSGGLEFGLCPGTVDGATFIAAAHDSRVQHHHHTGHHPPSCLFALSGTAVSSSASSAHVPAMASDDEPRVLATTPIFPVATTRVQMPRGPPEIDLN